MDSLTSVCGRSLIKIHIYYTLGQTTRNRVLKTVHDHGRGIVNECGRTNGRPQ